MISRISGKVVERGSNYLLLDIGNICYEVFIPTTVMQRIEENIADDGNISLITFHYLQVEPAKNIPVLIGFLNDIEKNNRLVTVDRLDLTSTVKRVQALAKQGTLEKRPMTITLSTLTLLKHK